MTTSKQNTQPTPPIAVSPDEAARHAGIGRTSLYAALAKGELKSIKIGTRRLIKTEAIHDRLAAHQTDTG